MTLQQKKAEELINRNGIHAALDNCNKCIKINKWYLKNFPVTAHYSLLKIKYWEQVKKIIIKLLPSEKEIKQRKPIKKLKRF